MNFHCHLPDSPPILHLYAPEDFPIGKFGIQLQQIDGSNILLGNETSFFLPLGLTALYFVLDQPAQAMRLYILL
jgi:hypothetical protein